jgi:hypothetical protein
MVHFVYLLINSYVPFQIVQTALHDIFVHIVCTATILLKVIAIIETIHSAMFLAVVTA